VPSGAANPSTVRTDFPCSWGRNKMQAFNAFAPSPSVIITEQAPQSPSLQPSLVPVRPSFSRKKSRSVRVGLSATTVTVSPFRRNSIFIWKTRHLTLHKAQCLHVRCGVERADDHSLNESKFALKTQGVKSFYSNPASSPKLH